MFPDTHPLPRRLAMTVAARGTQEAYIGPGERRTWLDLQAESRRIAAALHAAGIGHGDHVGVLLGNSGQWIATFFACASIGAVTVPVNTRFKADELLFCLKQADVRLLVYAERFLGIDFGAMLQEIEPALATGLPGAALPMLRAAVCVSDDASRALPHGAIAFDAFIDRGRGVAAGEIDTLAAKVAVDDVLLIQYTSGTTSYPKGVMLTHANMLGDAAAVAERMAVSADDRYFSIRPFFHVAGSTLSVLVSLVTGCCLLSLPKFDVAEALRVLDLEGCTLTSGNDTIFLMLMGHPDFDAGRLHLRGGWAAAGPEVMTQIRDVMRVPHICNAYGQSEASPNVVMSSWDDPFPLRAAGFMLPHAGTAVRIADAETGEPCAVGTPGEIQVKGWHVMRGYYRQPEATAKAFTSDGWLRTGDLGEHDAEGRIRMVGRLKDIYRVGGENVAPAEIEEVLHAHSAVQQAQVIGVPDARLGEVTGAFVLLKAGHVATPAELLDWCRVRCANFKLPRYLAIVDSFEHIGMTGSSKVQKNKLRAHAIERWGITPTTTVATR